MATSIDSGHTAWVLVAMALVCTGPFAVWLPVNSRHFWLAAAAAAAAMPSDDITNEHLPPPHRPRS